MKFELCKIDPYTASIEEVEEEIKRLKGIKEIYYGLEQSVKIFINSCYGACASPYFVGYNIYVAEAVTLQGQDIILFTNKILDDYLLNKWHLDTETHQKLRLTKVSKILSKTMVIYNDTDSLAGNSIVKTDDGDMTIEKFYNDNINNGSAGETLSGHESVNTPNKILNWSEEKSLYFAPVKRIIRHKVTKAKWKLKTKSGKEVIVTNDHSMIVFRNGKKTEVKPSEIIRGDKILCVK